MTQQLTINGNIYLSLASLKSPEGYPIFQRWDNIMVNSKGELFNIKKLNLGNLKPIAYYLIKNHPVATVSKPKTKDTPALSGTVYRDKILACLPNPFPEPVPELEPEQPKPKPITSKVKPVAELDEPHEMVKLSLLFPDDEWAETTYEDYTVTHRNNVYYRNKLEKWTVYGDDSSIKIMEGSRRIATIYKSELADLFKKYQAMKQEPEPSAAAAPAAHCTATTAHEKRRQEIQNWLSDFLNEDEDGQEPEPALDLGICIADLPDESLEPFTNYYFRNDNVYCDGKLVPWEESDGDKYVELVNGDKFESLDYEDLIDLVQHHLGAN